MINITQLKPYEGNYVLNEPVIIQLTIASMKPYLSRRQYKRVLNNVNVMDYKEFNVVIPRGYVCFLAKILERTRNKPKDRTVLIGAYLLHSFLSEIILTKLDEDPGVKLLRSLIGIHSLEHILNKSIITALSIAHLKFGGVRFFKRAYVMLRCNLASYDLIRYCNLMTVIDKLRMECYTNSGDRDCYISHNYKLFTLPTEEIEVQQYEGTNKLVKYPNLNTPLYITFY